MCSTHISGTQRTVQISFRITFIIEVLKASCQCGPAFNKSHLIVENIHSKTCYSCYEGLWKTLIFVRYCHWQIIKSHFNLYRLRDGGYTWFSWIMIIIFTKVILEIFFMHKLSYFCSYLWRINMPLKFTEFIRNSWNFCFMIYLFYLNLY